MRETPDWQPDFISRGGADGAFASIRAPFQELNPSGAWPTLADLNRLAHAHDPRNARGLPIRFVTQTQRHGQRDYEAGILASGRVPTRQENWHDLFNALIWLAFPKTKATLNQIQCHSLAGSPAGRRPALADAATLFDESGLLLVATDDSLFKLLRGHRWQEAFVTRRAGWQQVRAYVVGHALLEKALCPYPAITAKCLALTLGAEETADLPPDGPASPELDERLSQAWLGGAITKPADLFPLPILGIPGWWAKNTDPGFYNESNIFRPPRCHTN